MTKWTHIIAIDVAIGIGSSLLFAFFVQWAIEPSEVVHSCSEIIRSTGWIPLMPIQFIINGPPFTDWWMSRSACPILTTILIFLLGYQLRKTTRTWQSAGYVAVVGWCAFGALLVFAEVMASC